MKRFLLIIMCGALVSSTPPDPEQSIEDQLNAKGSWNSMFPPHVQPARDISHIISNSPQQEPSSSSTPSIDSFANIWQTLPPNIVSEIFKKIDGIPTSEYAAFSSINYDGWKRTQSDEFQVTSLLRETDPTLPQSKRISLARRKAVELKMWQALRFLGPPHENEFPEAMRYAVDNDDLKMVMFFCLNAKFIKPSNPSYIIDVARIQAVQKGRTDILAWILSTFDYDRYIVNMVDQASAAGYLDMVKFLMQGIPRDEIQSVFSAFLIAVRRGYFEIAQVFISYGIDISTNNYSVLQIAITQNRSDIVQLILESYLNIPKQTIEQMIHVARMSRHSDIALIFGSYISKRRRFSVSLPISRQPSAV